MFDLKGKVAVVTGASSGLGLQMSHAFADQGANLVITARRIERLEALAKELEAKGVQVVPVKCDVTKPEEVAAAAAKTKEVFGKADILVNCAGAAKNNDALEMTDEEWLFTMDADLNSVFYVTRAFGKMMREAKCGRIINIASMYGMVGNMAIPSSAYHASKGGVVNYTRACAAELAKDNITVNCICPGYFETELTKDTLDTPEFQQFMQGTVPMGRYGKSGELNAAAIFFASDEAAYVTGVILPVDGGYTCV